MSKNWLSILNVFAPARFALAVDTDPVSDPIFPLDQHAGRYAIYPGISHFAKCVLLILCLLDTTKNLCL